MSGVPSAGADHLATGSYFHMAVYNFQNMATDIHIHIFRLCDLIAFPLVMIYIYMYIVNPDI
mgnify:CR=1 FL=1